MGVRHAGQRLVGVAVSKATTQTISTGGGGTACQFDTELTDTDAFHDNSTNNTRLTVPVGMSGTYVIVGQGGWDSSATGKRVLDLRVSGSNYIQTAQFDASADAPDPTFQVVGLYPLVAGDYVELMAFQNSGTDRAITATLRMCRMPWS